MPVFLRHPQRLSSRAARGFTLFELILAVALLGILSIAVSPSLKTFLAVKEQSYRQQQSTANQRIAAAMMTYAEQNPGDLSTIPPLSLPTPYNDTPSKTYYGVAPLTGTSGVTPFLLQQGVPSSLFNDDGSGAQRVRSFQKVSNTVSAYPLFGQGGPLVNLSYDYGVLYQTDCPKSGSCNVSTLPKASDNTAHTVMTTLNYSTWAPLGSDTGTVFVSTLPLQKKLLDVFSQRIDRLRDAMKSFSTTMAAVPVASRCPNNFLSLPMCGSVGQTSCRWRNSNPNTAYPVPICLGAGTTDWYLGTNVSAVFLKNGNMGCWDGWFGLDTSNGLAVLQALGLNPAEYATTPWGGYIEYCADYQPQTSVAATEADAAPHYSAIRFHKNVSQGPIAGSMSSAANVVIMSW